MVCSSAHLLCSSRSILAFKSPPLRVVELVLVCISASPLNVVSIILLGNCLVSVFGLQMKSLSVGLGLSRTEYLVSKGAM